MKARQPLLPKSITSSGFNFCLALPEQTQLPSSLHRLSHTSLSPSWMPLLSFMGAIKMSSTPEYP